MCKGSFIFILPRICYMLSGKRKHPAPELGSPRKKPRLHSPLARGNSIVCRPTGANTKKRLVIKKLAVVPQLPKDFQETTWNKLSNAVTAVHNLAPVCESKETLYHQVKDLCTHRMSPKVYQSLYSKCKDHLNTVGKQLSELSSSIDVFSFLMQVERIWNDHCTQTRIIRDIFLYLDRTYVINECSNVKSLWDMGLLLFRDEVILCDPAILQKTVNGILSEIEQERNGKTIQRSLIQTLARMLTSLEIYSTSIEEAFLEQSRIYYRQEGLHRIDSDPVPVYLAFVKKKIQEEQERVSVYLEASTSSELLDIVHQELVLEHADSILAKGFESMMKDDALQDLHTLYTLFHYVKRLKQLKEYFNTHIKVRSHKYFNAFSSHVVELWVGYCYERRARCCNGGRTDCIQKKDPKNSGGFL